MSNVKQVSAEAAPMVSDACENGALSHRLDVLLRSGRLLMENGADTSRVLRDMHRVARYLGFSEGEVHIHVGYSMLMVVAQGSQGGCTRMLPVVRHGVSLGVLRSVSHLSWEALRRNYSLPAFERQLLHIARTKGEYAPLMATVGGGLACGGFCVQFGGDWLAFLYASLAAMTGLYLRRRLSVWSCNLYVGTAVAAFVSTVMAFLLSLLSQHMGTVGGLWGSLLCSATPLHPLLACALFIVPGVPLINFVSDMLSGHLETGMARAASTFMLLAAMAFGIAFAIGLCGTPALIQHLSTTPHHDYWEYMAAAATAAVGFSMLLGVPRRLLWVVAIGAVVSVCTRNFVGFGPANHNVGLGLGLITGSFAGSALVSMLCCLVVHRLHTPHQCLSIPSVIPMIPGVLMYRALFAFISMQGVVGEVTVAMYNAIQASLIILCIALGVAIPNIFFRRMINPVREQKLMFLLMERHKLQA